MSHKKPKPKKWYDSECYALRSTIRRLRRMVHADPFNRDLRNHMIQLCSKYKKLLRQKASELKHHLLHKLNTIDQGNPKEFWKTLDELKEGGKQESSTLVDQIEPQQWADHFETLAKSSTDKQKTTISK